MKTRKKLPKARKGAWFVRVRNSYLPVTAKGWMMHAILMLGGFDVIYASYKDERTLVIVMPLMLLQLVGLGTIFTWIASRKA
jgi:hypothetical protein